MIQGIANGLINDKIGGAKTDIGGLKALEVKITIEKIKAIHEKRAENLKDIWIEHRSILDNYRPIVSIGDLHFGRHDSY